MARGGERSDRPDSGAPVSRKDVIAQRRAQQRHGKGRLIVLALVAALVVGGALAAMGNGWDSTPVTRTTTATGATPKGQRPFSLAPGSVILIDDSTSSSTDPVHSETPRPTPTRQFDAPGKDASGKATFHFLPVAEGDSGRSGKVTKYTVEVEDGVQFDEDQANRMIRATLSEPRGWEVTDKVHFVQIPESQAGDADMQIRFASPGTTTDECGRANVDVEGEYSCTVGHKIILNVRRWLVPRKEYQGKMADWQSMLINHQVGYVLGKPEAKTCPGKGKPAPIMMAQTIDMKGCGPNAWPKVA